MEYFTVLIFSAIASTASTITISPNGNSPEVKMLGGMMVDMQKGFVPMTTKSEENTTEKSNYEKSLKLNSNSTKLSLNERYRRLIPYMTFYYANDLLPPTTEAYDAKNIEVAQAEILEAKTQEQRQPKKLIYSSQRNIPRYQGNRLTQYNIASAHPIIPYHKEIIPVYQNSAKFGNNPIQSDFNVLTNQDYERYVHKPVKSPSAPFSMPVRKPYLNLYPEDNAGNVQYYLSEKEQSPKYKLVPYEQTPPVKVVQQGEQHYFDAPKKTLQHSVLFPKEPVFIKPRPRPQIYYENINIPQVNYRKQPNIVSESYYEKRQPQHTLAQPVIEGGFKPIVNRPLVDDPIFSGPETQVVHFENEKQHAVQVIDNEPLSQDPNYTPNYYNYVVEQPVYKPEPYTTPNTINLQHLISSLQLNKSIPKSITRENVGSSIRTLLQVLNTLKAAPQMNEVESPVLSTPKPFIASKAIVVTSEKPLISVGHVPVEDLHDEEPYLAPVNTPSQHLDDFGSSHGGTSQRFPQPINSDDEGGTPGRPGVDYPVLTVIPPTKFDCKTQRYKGFFADPETRCQVWHYCDLNGGQASFLCPNGTIFSQAGLTCDWWFNVKCDSTAQLYVLNESLYKYILPHSPKFPEDYSGPLVDKYLTLKFKEMEEQFRKNKNKQASEKMSSDEEKSDESEDATESPEGDKNDGSTVSEASVMVQSPGTSGNVERLQD